MIGNNYFYRSKWPEQFPNVVLNAGLGDASKNEHYLEAKNGDLLAASKLVADILNQVAIKKLTEIIGSKKPILIPVHAEESISINRIPLAYAVAIGRILNLDVELNIVQSARVNRTGADGFARLSFPPPFTGIPSQESKYAIIIDDTLTQGGTIANLIGYVDQFGIESLAATTLTGKNYSSVLAIKDETLAELRRNYEKIEEWWIIFFGYDFSRLTESEARYIINSKKNANEIRDRIIAERQKGFF